MGFDDLGLGPNTRQAVADAGYVAPTPIQSQAIPVILQGRDVLGCAQTGTGKTASFTLPMIDILSAGRARARMPRSIILTPTRELAAQIAQNFEIYGKYDKLTMALLIGGVSIDDQKRKLERGVDVLIATPGRMIDLFERGAILLSGVKILVIDEADRMLDMGFIPDVERIVGTLPKIRQTLMFSATIMPEIRQLADKFLISPKEITVAPPASPAEMVVQAVSYIGARDKRAALRALLTHEPVENALIFCNRKKDVDILDRSLRSHGFKSAAMHGDMPQLTREETLASFKDGSLKLLVATDVAGRGLDIKGLSHVFNFDVPIHAEDYVHRIGRTGRAGMPGRAFMLAAPSDAKYLGAIRRLIKRDIPEHQIDEMTREAAQADAADKAPAGRPRRSMQKKPAKTSGTAAKREPAKTTRESAKTTREAARPKRAAAKAKPADTEKSKPRPTKGPVVGMGDHVPAFMRTRIKLTG